MRLNRKWILVIALVLSMATAISGTLAYLTSTDTATNTFTVGNVSIDLEEPSYTGNNQTLLPGVEIAKDPQIKNTGSTEAWVWMEITVPSDLMNYIDWNTTDWTKTEATSGTNTVVTMKRTTTLAAGATTAKAFTKVALPASLTSMPASLGTGNVNIVVNAYAIQTASAYGTIDEAIAAYGTNGEGGNEGGEGGEPSVSYTEVATAEALNTALQNGGNVKLTENINLQGTQLTVPTGKTVTLNLNGYNITDTLSAPASMITNNGTMTITGNGSIALTFNGTVDNSKAANTIANRGVMVIDGATITNNGISNQIGYAIDNYNGSTLTVHGGTITASDSSYYDGIRLFCGSSDTLVTINGGNVSSIWAQNPSEYKATAVKGTVVLNDGSVATTYYENYTTVKVADGKNFTVTAYGNGSESTTTTTENGYIVYSFIH